GRHYLVKQGKSVGRCIQVVLAATHQRAQPVRRDHLIRTVCSAAQTDFPDPDAPTSTTSAGSGNATTVPGSVGSTAPAWQTLIRRRARARLAPKATRTWAMVVFGP